MQIGVAARLQVIRAMLADPVNRLCIEKILDEVPFGPVYPCPLRSDDGRMAYIVSLNAIRSFAPAMGPNSSDLFVGAKVLDPCVLIRPIQSPPNTFEATLYIGGASNSTLGPFSTREEAILDCSAMLLSEFNIIVLTQPDV